MWMDIDEKISVRFEKNELSSLDRLVKESRYSSRSEFIRQAIKNQVEVEKRRNSITVEVPGLVMGYIDALVRKEYFRSKEHAIQKAIDHYFDDERVNSAFRAAKSMEMVSGRSVNIDLEVDEKAAKHIKK